MNNECLHHDPERTARPLSDLGVTKKVKPLLKTKEMASCFKEAGFHALIIQFWNIHWTLCWPSDLQVKHMWMREEQLNDKCNGRETKVNQECPKWNVNARRVSHECPPKAGYQPKSHFYLVFLLFISVLSAVFPVLKYMGHFFPQKLYWWRYPLIMYLSWYKYIFSFKNWKLPIVVYKDLGSGL